MLVQLTYWSKITNHCSDKDCALGKCEAEDLQALKEHAIVANEKSGITGCLLRLDEYYLQTLEGSTANVNALFHKLQEDTRHHKLQLVSFQPITRRKYNDWMMVIDATDDEHRSFLLSYSSRVPFAFEEMSPIAVDMIIHEMYTKIKKARRFTDPQ